MTDFEYRILKPQPHRHRALFVGVAVVVVLAAAAGAVVALRPAGTRPASGGRTAAGGGSVSTVAVPLTVVSTTPATGATNVPSNQAVTVHLSSAVSRVGTPAWSPPVAGSWVRSSPTTLTFDAAAAFVPTVTETLTLPAGATGPSTAAGGHLAAPTTVSFTVAQAPTERLQQLLGQLDYLPLSFTPATSTTPPNGTFTAQPGSFTWRWPGLPADLVSLWTEGTENVITKGAVMTFQSANGLPVDGIAGPQVWSALAAAVAGGKTDAQPWNYVLVSKTLPENLTLWSNGAVVMGGVPVNTGVPGADTADGTYPVFEHVTASRMVGTNPDGSHYDDPAVPWASYFNGGDALHGFVRATYGSPQSNGCVEMPIATAGQIWPYTPIGTLVTVVGPPS
jgi:peptidoglycan hydrolase-like protein with peptidoglycan-binding domain